MKKQKYLALRAELDSERWYNQAVINGEPYDPVYVWEQFVPNCGRAEMHRRLWYWDGKKKAHIPRGICFDCSRDCFLYRRDGGVVPPQGWNRHARYSHFPRPIICGRVRYGKRHPSAACIVPPLNLDGTVFEGTDRTEHLKAILNGLAKLCEDALAGRQGFVGQDAIERFTSALWWDREWRWKTNASQEECGLRARVVVANYLSWYEGWTKAGQPIEPEVED